jgi:hypothetical protein
LNKILKDVRHHKLKSQNVSKAKSASDFRWNTEREEYTQVIPLDRHVIRPWTGINTNQTTQGYSL